MNKKYVIAVVGATGVVGQEMLKVLAERDLPLERLLPLASERSAGSRIEFGDQEIKVELLTEDSFQDVDIALFSAGAKVSEKYAPIAVSSGAVVIDNTSFFRMDPKVPLIVPEVNGEIVPTEGIIANPNCSTAQMVLALKPIYDAVGIKRVVVSTYQAVSGSGKEAVDELQQQIVDILQMKSIKKNVYPHQIAFNVLPHIDVFMDNGYTKEEIKMINETKKIFGDDSIQVTATTVRVPVFYGHSESVNIETKNPITADEVRSLLAKTENVVVEDDPKNNIYPMPINAAGKNETFVGRITRENQLLRFQKIYDLIEDKPFIKVLDVGCGLGDFYNFLQEKGFQGDYLGIDIVPEMVDSARLNYPEGVFEIHDIMKNDIEADYIVASGIMSVRINKKIDHQEYVDKLIVRLFSQAKRGIVFNMLNDQYVDADKYFFPFSPYKIVEYLLTLTNQVEIYHDYLHYDFTCTLGLPGISSSEV